MSPDTQRLQSIIGFRLTTGDLPRLVRFVWQGAPAELIRDPDGHLHQIDPQPAEPHA